MQSHGGEGAGLQPHAVQVGQEPGTKLGERACAALAGAPDWARPCVSALNDKFLHWLSNIDSRPSVVLLLSSAGAVRISATVAAWILATWTMRMITLARATAACTRMSQTETHAAARYLQQDPGIILTVLLSFFALD